MSDNLPTTESEATFADRWFQRFITYAGLPTAIIFYLVNQWYLMAFCMLWLAAAVGYTFIKSHRKDKTQELGLGTLTELDRTLAKVNRAIEVAKEHPNIPIPIENPDARPKTLQELIRTDFPGCLLQSSSLTIGRSTDADSLFPVEIEMHLISNFTAKSELVGFYIPQTMATFTICQLLVTEYRQAFGMKNNVIIEGGFKDEPATTSKDLQFTKRVYIYHETPLLKEQKELIEKLFKKKRLSVILRDPSYAFDRNYKTYTYPNVVTENSEKRLFKINELQDLIKEYKEIYKPGLYPVVDYGRDFRTKEFEERVKRILKKHFGDSYVERYEKDRLSALEEFQDEILD